MQYIESEFRRAREFVAGTFRGRTKENRPNFVRRAQAITAQELLGSAALSEEKGLSITTDPLHIYEIGLNAGTEYVAVFNSPLKKNGFRSLLSTVAPAKNYADYGVIDDWQMPDRQGSHLLPGYYERLLRLHQTGLGNDFADFEKHRKSFIAMLDQDTEIRDGFDRFLANGPITSEQLRVLFLNELSSSATNKDAGVRLKNFVTSPASGEFRAKLQRSLEGTVRPQFDLNKARGKERNLVRHLYRKSPAEFNAAVQRIFFRLGEVDQAVFIDGFGVRTFGLLALDSPTGRIYVHQQQDPRTTVEDLQDGTFRLRRDEHFVDFSFQKNPQGDIIMEQLETNVETGPIITPVLRWRNDGQQRSVNVDNLAPEMLVALGLNSDPGNFDTLLGFLTAAYLSPEVTKQWPRSVGLPDGRYVQAMGPAQVPVLALMRRLEIMNTPFFAAAEMHAKSTAVAVS